MRRLIAATLALTGITIADTSAKFRLRTANNPAVADWAILNTRYDEGTYLVYVQQSQGYQSDVSFLDGDLLFFEIPFESIAHGLRVPDVPEGQVSEVYTQQGKGVPGFVLSDDGYLMYNGTVEGWWACPINDVYSLFYGVEPDEANLPSILCQSFQLAFEYI
ncbi:hypothetical protein F5B22DRAFT_600572 [Xylaria bambusicola]|uniref:uncharacterized protein n=1 Tax=Xylaria bambusicola TaxID=326684 RepID=UPI002008CFBB|nr:uncharacterized protein F5B22DRAFT_600572 [Xylaria bambusicola]KAI0518266.1 hypothetical protein F5B22DRAFT_600572 [Xylaria bambusicola]